MNAPPRAPKLLYYEALLCGTPYQKGRWVEIAIHDVRNIHGFFGPYFFLSNGWRSAVFYRGMYFPSVENAYQAAKFGMDMQSDFTICSPIEAIEISRQNEAKIVYTEELWRTLRVDVMRILIASKFADRILGKMLIATDKKHLAETNWWGDYFWGSDEHGNGEDNLGKLLMEHRDLLRKNVP